MEAMEQTESESTDEPTEIDSNQNWTVKTIFTVPSGETFDNTSQEQLEAEVQNLFPNDTFTFLWVPLSQTITGKNQPTETENDRHLKGITVLWESFFNRTLPAEASVEDLSITWAMKAASERSSSEFSSADIEQYIVSFDVFVPQEEARIIEAIRERARLFARITFEQPVAISIRGFAFSKQEVLTNPN